MTVIPNPVILTEASTSESNKVGARIYDNGECIEGISLHRRFVGLYQNGVEVGIVIGNETTIQYNGMGALRVLYREGYTLSLQLMSRALPNGDYVAVVSLTIDGETKNYIVPIRVEVPRASITEYQNELERASLTKYGYELNLT